MMVEEEAHEAFFYLEVIMALLVAIVSYGALIEIQQRSYMDCYEDDAVYSTTCCICR